MERDVETSDLDQRASLSLWPAGRPGGAVPGREFATVREAIAAAAPALREAGTTPWIVTEDGSILRPEWIRLQARALHLL